MTPHDMRLDSYTDPVTITCKFLVRCIRCGSSMEAVVSSFQKTSNGTVTSFLKKRFMKTFTVDCDEAMKLNKIREIHES